jgi:hypothetical protein
MSNLINNPVTEQLMPGEAIDKPVVLAVVVAYLVLFNVGSWFLLNKRDMKG